MLALCPCRFWKLSSSFCQGHKIVALTKFLDRELSLELTPECVTDSIAKISCWTPRAEQLDRLSTSLLQSLSSVRLSNCHRHRSPTVTTALGGILFLTILSSFSVSPQSFSSFNASNSACRFILWQCICNFYNHASLRWEKVRIMNISQYISFSWEAQI